MPEAPSRTLDHIVHAVSDLDAAAEAYTSSGFTVTPPADHPFGTSNRLVVLDGTYIEIVAVTRPQQLPDSGFAARVAQRLWNHGEGITHVVLSSNDPPADLAALGPLATGEIFSFSRPAPQPDGSAVKASFECTLMHGTDDLGMFLCKHMAPDAVWNDHSTWHSNLARTVEGLALPVERETLETLAAAARCHVIDDSIRLGQTMIRTARHAQVSFDAKLPPVDICGVRVGGSCTS